MQWRAPAAKPQQVEQSGHTSATKWVQTRCTSWATFSLSFSLVDSKLLLTFTHKYPPFGEAHNERKRRDGMNKDPPFRLPYQFLIQAFHCAKNIIVRHNFLLWSYPFVPFVFFHGYTSCLKSGSMASGLKLDVTLPLLKHTSSKPTNITDFSHLWPHACCYCTEIIL